MVASKTVLKSLTDSDHEMTQDNEDLIEEETEENKFYMNFIKSVEFLNYEISIFKKTENF